MSFRQRTKTDDFDQYAVDHHGMIFNLVELRDKDYAMQRINKLSCGGACEEEVNCGDLKEEECSFDKGCMWDRGSGCVSAV